MAAGHHHSGDGGSDERGDGEDVNSITSPTAALMDDELGTTIGSAQLDPTPGE